MEGNIELFVKNAEEKYGRGGNTYTSRCATGDFVDTIALSFPQCVKPEGEPYPTYKTKDEAWTAFLTAFDQYMSDRSGPIYWRCEPSIDEMFSCDGFGSQEYYSKGAPKPDGYVVHCRLFAVKELNAKD